MTVTAIRTLTPAQATKLWSDLRGHFVNAEKKIIEIIEARAWEPLGFESFAEAWASKMQGVPLATDAVRAHVVYAMLDGGLTDSEVLDATGIGSQIGPNSVDALRRQRSNGVPASSASTRVRSHIRRNPSAPRTVHVQLSADEYAAFRECAAERESDTATLAAQLIREYLER